MFGFAKKSGKNLDLRLPDIHNMDAGHLAGGGRAVGFREGNLVCFVVIFLFFFFVLKYSSHNVDLSI